MKISNTNQTLNARHFHLDTWVKDTLIVLLHYTTLVHSLGDLNLFNAPEFVHIG